MPSVQNTERLAEIKEDLTDIQAMWVVDYRGLTVKQSEQLRNSIREAGAIMKVHKNKLVRLALRFLLVLPLLFLQRAILLLLRRL